MVVFSSAYLLRKYDTPVGPHKETASGEASQRNSLSWGGRESGGSDGRSSMEFMSENGSIGRAGATGGDLALQPTGGRGPAAPVGGMGHKKVTFKKVS